MALLVLRHVDPHQVVLVVEEKLGERSRQLCLPNTGRPQEDEAAHRPLRVGQPRTCPPDCVGERSDRRVLADDPLVQPLLHVEQPLGLAFDQPRHRDTGAERNLLGNVVGRDSRSHGVLRPPLLLFVAVLVLQLEPPGAQVRGPLVIVARVRRRLLVGKRPDLLLHLFQLGRHAFGIQLQLRRGLVDQVDRFVGELPAGDVAPAETHRGAQGFVLDRHPVVLLVARPQRLEHAHSRVDVGLVDLDRREAALERLVRLHVAAVLVGRRRAHGLQLAACQSRLHHAAGVYRALCGPGPDDGVQLVDEQDDLAAGALRLVEHRLQPLLELAAHLRAGDQRPHVEGQHAPAL